MTRDIPEELWDSHVFWKRWGPCPLGILLEALVSVKWDYPTARFSQAGDVFRLFAVGKIICAECVRWGVITWAPGRGGEPHLLVETCPWASGLWQGPCEVWGCHQGLGSLQVGRLLVGLAGIPHTLAGGGVVVDRGHRGHSQMLECFFQEALKLRFSTLLRTSWGGEDRPSGQTAGGLPYLCAMRLQGNYFFTSLCLTFVFWKGGMATVSPHSVTRKIKETIWVHIPYSLFWIPESLKPESFFFFW